MENKERIYSALTLYSRVHDRFDNKDKVFEWFNLNNSAFKDNKPLDIISNGSRAEVRELLNLITNH